MIDPSRCDGDGRCLAACPYGKVFLNPLSRVAEKCVGCFPLLERGQAPACAAQCSGRAIHVGRLGDAASSVHQLVFAWKVALPLRPDFGTGPNVFYVPPFLGPEMEDTRGLADGSPRIPEDYLEGQFGPAVRTALATLRSEQAKRQKGEPSRLMDLLIAYQKSDLVGTIG